MPNNENPVTIENFSRDTLREDHDLSTISYIPIGALERTDDEAVVNALNRVGERYDAFVRGVLDIHNLEPLWIDHYINTSFNADISDFENMRVPGHLTGIIATEDLINDDGFTGFYLENAGRIAMRYMDYARVLGQRGYKGAQYFFWQLAVNHGEYFRSSFEGGEYRQARNRMSLRVGLIGEINREHLMLEIMEEVEKGRDESLKANHMDLARLRELNSLLDTLEEERVLEAAEREIIPEVAGYYTEQVFDLLKQSQLSIDDTIAAITALARAEVEDMSRNLFRPHIRDLEWGRNIMIDYEEIDEGHIYYNSHGAVIQRYMDYSELMRRAGNPVAQAFFHQMAISHADLFGRGGEYLDELVRREDIIPQFNAILEGHLEEIVE